MTLALLNGRQRVVWHGVRSAMQVLLGSRGGVDILESDANKVYDHLAEHCHEFDREPPPFH